MRENAALNFLGGAFGGTFDGRHNIRRNFLERLDVKIATGLLNHFVEIFRDFHAFATTDVTLRATGVDNIFDRSGDSAERRKLYPWIAALCRVAATNARPT